MGRRAVAERADLVGAGDLAVLVGAGLVPQGPVAGATAVAQGSLWIGNRNETLLYRRYDWGPPRITAGTATFPCPHPANADGIHRRGLNWELVPYREALDQAAGGALAGLRETARRRAAHGVVGVSLRVDRHGRGGRRVQAVATGTAVLAPGCPVPATPFLCGGGPQDVVRLRDTGLVPTDVVVGHGVIGSVPGCDTWRRLDTMMDNTEVPQIADAIDRAQAVALQRLTSQAPRQGVVGVEPTVVVRDRSRHARIVEVRMVGTAVRHFAGAAAARPVRTFLSFGDR